MQPLAGDAEDAGELGFVAAAAERLGDVGGELVPQGRLHSRVQCDAIEGAIALATGFSDGGRSKLGGGDDRLREGLELSARAKRGPGHTRATLWSPAQHVIY